MSQDNNNNNNNNSNNNNNNQQSSSSGRQQQQQPPKNVPPSNPADSNNNNTSLSNRIQTSASGLARGVFQAGSASSSADLARVLASGNKAVSSSTGPSYSSTSGVTGPPAVPTQLPSSESFSFRSSSRPVHEHTEEIDEFQTQSHFQPEQILLLDEDAKGKGKQPDLSTFNTAWQSASSSSTDGQAVISLLTNPSFDPAFTHDQEDDVNTTNALESELLPTRAEYEMLDSFRRLPPPSHNVGIRSTSLIPDIGTFLDSVPQSHSSDATDLRDAVLYSLAGGEDWLSVEEGYHDEVWGYLKPTLEAAKRELDRHHNDEKGRDGPAVQRLKMVLGHMRSKL